MDESTRNGPLAELTNYPVEITLLCGCTSVKSGHVSLLIEKLGPQATIAEAERRMKCQTCGKRPRVVLGWQWGFHPTRRRKEVPPLPGWCKIG
jgi:hypothetical protein